MPVTWPNFIVLVLAVTRLTVLLVQEDGPAGLLAWLREQQVGKVFRCSMCVSVWMAVIGVLVMWRGGEVGEFVLYALALSMGAILVMRVADWIDAVMERVKER